MLLAYLKFERNIRINHDAGCFATGTEFPLLAVDGFNRYSFTNKL